MCPRCKTGLVLDGDDQWGVYRYCMICGWHDNGGVAVLKSPVEDDGRRDNKRPLSNCGHLREQRANGTYFPCGECLRGRSRLRYVASRERE